MPAPLVRLSLILSLLLALAPTVGAGAADKALKGRYLELGDGVDLAAYRGAIVLLEPSTITTDKGEPEDSEAVRAASDAMLRDLLMRLGLFAGVAAAAPVAIESVQPLLRLRPRLDLRHGSRALRIWIGGGAGKSKLHIRIDLSDDRTGEPLGYFNGYGTGAGTWSLAGGKVEKMALDDLAENYQKLGELLAEALR